MKFGIVIFTGLLSSIASASTYKVTSITPKSGSEDYCLTDNRSINLDSRLGSVLNITLDLNQGVLIVPANGSGGYAEYETNHHEYTASPAGGSSVITDGIFAGADQFKIDEVTSDGLTKFVVITKSASKLTVYTEFGNVEKTYKAFQMCELELIK